MNTITITLNDDGSIDVAGHYHPDVQAWMNRRNKGLAICLYDGPPAKPWSIPLGEGFTCQQIEIGADNPVCVEARNEP